MMWIARRLMAAALLSLLGSATMALADEKKIPIEDLPKVVLRAAQKAFPDAQIVSASKETEDDETIYEVGLKFDGKSIDLEIFDDGEIESVEKEIDADDLPKAVTRAFAKFFPKGKIVKVEEVSDSDDMVVYELTVTNGGKESIEVVFSPNGKILDDEDDEEDEVEKEKATAKKPGA